MDIELYDYANSLFEDTFRKDWGFFKKELIVFNYLNFIRSVECVKIFLL